jgi:hypothetical protein
MKQKFLWILSMPEDNRGSEEVPERKPEVGNTHQAAPEGPGAARGVLAPSMLRSTASLLYKYSKIPETLEESMKNNSSRRKFQNHQIQSRHHHGGVHHPHWCLSDDA